MKPTKSVSSLGNQGCAAPVSVVVVSVVWAVSIMWVLLFLYLTGVERHAFGEELVAIRIRKVQICHDAKPHFPSAFKYRVYTRVRVERALVSPAELCKIGHCLPV